MKNPLFRFILSAFLLLTLTVFGQNNDYPTKKVNGIDYYVYTVQNGEGLLAIGRKFEISSDEISKINPETQKGLKAGQEILIPVPKKSGKKNKTENKPKISQQFIQHKVEKKQTLFAISHKYNVNQEDLKKYNPEIANGLKDGIILQIPVAPKESNQKITEKLVEQKTKTPETKNTIENQHFKTHIVKQNETLFSISKRYNVEISEVVQANPGSETKIAVGSELKIPTGAEVSKFKEIKEKKKETVEESTSKSVFDFNDLISKSNSAKNEHRVIKIAFLLPFMLDQSKKDPKLDRFINFYAGALLAIEQAKENGISFEIYTYDTEGSEDKITEVLNNSELKTMDLLIGPAYTGQVQLVSNFAKDYRVNTLIPFTAKVSDLDSNPYLFQFNPGSDAELDFTKELLNSKLKNMHVVFAQIDGVSPTDEGYSRAEDLRALLKKKNKSFGEIQLSNSEDIDFSSVLKKGDKNLIIFNTDKYSNISPYLSALRTNSTNFDITLLQQYSWRNQPDKMPKSIYISPFISDFNSSLLSNFNKQFDQYYGRDVVKDSPRYDLLGYDLTNYFIALIHRYGNKFGAKINQINYAPGIQSEPLFERSSSNSGFINQRVYLGEDKAQ